MAYRRDQPVDGDDLSISAPILRANTNQSDTSFGVDHYAFSDQTSNNGLHKKVTTINQPGLPITDPNQTILVGYSPYPSSFGGIQYSCGAFGAVPTPITNIQSQVGPITISGNSSADVLDFTGINFALATFYATGRSNFLGGVTAYVYGIVGRANGNWNLVNISNSILSIAVSGNFLILKNTNSSTANQIIWALDFKRIQ